jgi:sulfane dehydrogenase subunit SoxC
MPPDDRTIAYEAGSESEMSPEQETAQVSRRGLMQLGGAAAVAAALPVAVNAVQPTAAVAAQADPVATPDVAEADALPPAIPPWMTAWGPLPSEYGSRSIYESGVVRLPSATSSRSPLRDFFGSFTPNSLFYERHHAGVPTIDPRLHRLMVHGLVDRPTIFTMEDIKRFPAVSVINFMECSGNSGSEWTEERVAPTVQAGFGLVSQAEWTGVPVKTILEEVGVHADGTWVLAEGADAAGMTRSIPMDKLMDDAILAYGMNGEMLRPENGYPLRLFLPGWEGNSSIKWLRRLEVGTEPWQTREETSKYTDPMPDGTARQFTFVMEAKSVITYPSGGDMLTSQGFHEITGIAWSGRGTITRVEVSTDGGETWADAELQGPTFPITLTRFRFPWTWEGQAARLQSRCTDDTGYVQPTIESLVEVRGTGSIYHMNGIKTWAVSERGEVTSAWG